MCVAQVDLLRTKGMWLASVRYGYCHGALTRARSLVSDEVLPHMWDARPHTVHCPHGAVHLPPTVHC